MLEHHLTRSGSSSAGGAGSSSGSFMEKEEIDKKTVIRQSWTRLIRQAEVWRVTSYTAVCAFAVILLA
jgi:hypothetical protein